MQDSPARRLRLQKEESLPPMHVCETKLIVESLILFCKEVPDQIPILWRLLTVFESRTLTDFTFLVDFCKTHVAHGFTPAQKRELMVQFVKFYADASVSRTLKVNALEYIVIPMLEVSFAVIKKEQEQSGAADVPPTTAPPEGQVGSIALTVQLHSLLSCQS
jgi:hypothetical protein